MTPVMEKTLYTLAGLAWALTGLLYVSAGDIVEGMVYTVIGGTWIVISRCKDNDYEVVKDETNGGQVV